MTAVTFVVTTLNVPPTVNSGSDTTIEASTPLSRTGSFTDPGADTWTATVNYGDGSGVQSLIPFPTRPSRSTTPTFRQVPTW